MKKLSLFMLMAVGLLISGNAWGAGDVTAADDDAAVAAGAVAKIGDQYYSTFALAVTDANATTNATITLLQEEVAFAGATLSKTMTLDLNGKTLKYNTKTKTITISAAVTISIQNGTLSDGGVAVSNGLITMAKDKAILNLTNVHLSCPTGGYPIYTKTATPTININEGTTLEGKSGLCYFYINTKVNNKVVLEGVINAVGNKTITWTNIDGGSLTLTGGYVPATMTGYTLASGKKTINTYHATYLASKQIVADDAEIVATQVNGDVTYEYVSMATAIPAAKVGSKTIVMQRDADLTAAATMVAGSTLDLGGFTLRPTTAACSLTCNTKAGGYTIKNGKIDAGEIKIARLIYLATGTDITLKLEDVDLVNKGTYDVCSAIGSSTLKFDAATTFTKGVYASVKGSTASPLTINPPTGQENDYVMTNVAVGDWRMVKIADAKFTVTDEENTTYHSVWGEALYDAKLAAGKTLKMFDDVTLTAAATLHNGTLDMNEHSITFTGNCGLSCCVVDNAVVTIKDGTINSTNASKTYGAITINSKTGAQVSLQNMKVNAPTYYAVQMNTASKSNTLTIDADCELTGKTYAIYVYEACTPTINNYATLTQNIYATADPSLTINNYGTIPGLSFSKANAKNHTINNYTGGAIVFNPNQTLSGQVTLHNEGTLDIQKIVSNMVITGNGTFKLISGSYVNIDLPAAATYVDLAEGTIIRAEDLQDVGAAPEGLKWLNPTMQGGVVACKLVKADAETVCKIGDYEYISLADAVAAVPTDGTETQITLVKDLTATNVTIANTKNVVLELNGKVLSLPDGATKAVLINNGTLTIQDNTDYLVPVLNAMTLEPMPDVEQYRGNGTGKITSAFINPDMSGMPRYASNTITNQGTLYVKSGWIENLSDGFASYAIDNYGNSREVYLYISGGKITSNQSESIRMYMYKCTNNVCTITGGEIDRIWAQDNQETEVGSLIVSNTTLSRGLLANFNNKIKNFVLKLDNCIVEDYILYNFPAVETNELVLNNCKSGALYMKNPRSVLTNGLYQFHKEVGLGWCYVDESEEYKPWYGEEAWKAKGVRIAYDEQHSDPTYAKYYQGYLSAEAHLHGFYDYIISPYGLVARPDVGEGWYEVALQSQVSDYGTPGVDDYTTKIDPAGGDDDPNLANYWHKTQTWADAEVPVSGDPVLIDHNVIVEAGTTANAASVVINSNQKLIVEEGATLHIEDAGALFKDETAKLVIEPTGVVSVGANGVIADNVNNIVVQAKGQEVGVFLVDPKVTINTQPQGTVEMIANVGKRTDGDYNWHRFALPVVELKTAWTKEPDYPTYLYAWDYDTKDWKSVAGGSTDMIPFLGYTITTGYNNEPVQDVKYTFTGNLLGNEASQIDFTNIGYGYFGNSYTGHMLTKVLLGDVMGLEGVVGTAWLWDPASQLYSAVSMQDLIKDRDLEGYQREVAPMQTFILKLNSGSGATIDIDYADAIWSNPRYGLVPEPISAPAFMGNDDAFISLKVSSTFGQTDKVRMTESNEYSDEYENGVDAPKFMNEGKINMFTTVGNENYTSLYTNNLESKILTLQTIEEARYTLTVGLVEGSDYALVDLQTGNIISLVEGTTYDFVAQPNSTEERFQVIRTHQAPTSMDKVVNKKAAKGIFTPLGQYIGESNSLKNLPSGVYFVDGVKVVK